MITVPNAAIDYSRYPLRTSVTGGVWVECLLCDVAMDEADELTVDAVLRWIKRHRKHCEAGTDNDYGLVRSWVEREMRE